MQYWWVNQNQTYIFEVPGGYMWPPKANINGAYNQFYENMKDVAPATWSFLSRIILSKRWVSQLASELMGWFWGG